MQLFVRIAETGSFTAVADQLDVARFGRSRAKSPHWKNNSAQS
jgi:hypothetical protein